MRILIVVAAWTFLVLATGTVSIRFQGVLLLALIAVLVVMASASRRH